jgi:hypothetical protein
MCRIGWWKGLVLVVLVVGRLIWRGEVVRRLRVDLVSRGVVGVRSSWVGRSLEVGWVQEQLTIEGWRHGWRVLKGSGMSTRLVKLTKFGKIGEAHRCVGLDPVYHDSGHP